MTQTPPSFGRFVREQRILLQLSRNAFAAIVGVTEKRIYDIEKMNQPDVHETTFVGLARALRVTPEELRDMWSRQTSSALTPAGVPRLEPELAREWDATCASLGLRSNDALHFVCTWFINQNVATQQQVLQGAAPARHSPRRSAALP